MAITILEHSKTDKSTAMQDAVVQIFDNVSPLLKVLPFDEIEGNAISFTQEASLPGTSDRGVNEGYAATQGSDKQVLESLKIHGGRLVVDKYLLATGGEDVREKEEGKQIKAIGHNYSLAFIKGSTDVNPKSIDGLQSRLTGDQIVENHVSGGALKMAKMDELVDSVDNPTHLIMSKAMRRILKAARRSIDISGHITFEPDEFGKDVMHYDGLPILVLTDAARRDNILPFTELAPDEVLSTSSSIYCVSFTEEGLIGIQNGLPRVYESNMINGQPQDGTLVEWYQGLKMNHDRAATRLAGITNLPAVA